MKKYLFFATALVALAACTSDEYVGVEDSSIAQGTTKTISFGSGLNAVTRANWTGADAAAKLNNNFVVEGVKGDGTIAGQNVVFDNYNVNWVANTANTTTSNTNDWEYVNQTVNGNASIAAQSIKFWDYAAAQYDFIAYSLGTSTGLTVSPIDASKMNGVASGTTISDGAYTLTGTAAELKKAYIADMVTAYRNDGTTANSDYQNTVQFKFRSLSAKVRIGLYEIVPGYSVQAGSVKFYKADDSKSTTANLYTTDSDVFYEGGTYVVYFPTTGSANTGETDYNKAHVAFKAGGTSSATATDKTFGTLLGSLAADNFAGKEVAETDDNLYLGRASNQAIYAGTYAENYYTEVLPNEMGVVLNLKVDYTLISTDGSGETINVTGATAQVPATYATWKPGYAYTYLFKISQKTPGHTDPSVGPAGLYPITFDAVVVETEDGVQETITTVDNPSITTYAKGEIVTANDEYKKNNNIYVMVDGVTLTDANAKLYTVELASGAAQTINEASVANALAYGTETSTGVWTVTDANNKAMTVTTDGGLSIVTQIAATDAPDGNAITVNAAKFTPTAAGTYAFEYIKTPRTEGTYSAVAVGTTLTAGDTYYTSARGAGEFVATGTEVAADADGKRYWTCTSAGTPGEYFYKIIKVVN